VRHPKPRQLFAPLSADKVNEEFETLQSSSGWTLTEFQRLFSQLRNDPGGWTAFEKLDKRGYPKAILLLSLGATFSNKLHFWREWTAWESKWDGLGNVVKTLRRIETKMKRHLEKNDRGPIPLPTLSGTTEGSEEYIRSHMAERRLRDIHKALATAAAEIEEYCRTRRKWLRDVPRRDIAEKESIGLFMRSVKGRTGKWYLSDVEQLLRVGNISITAETLRKMLKFRTPLLDRWDIRTGYRWEQKPENSDQKLPPNFR
jgi:hypothetical protein